MHMPQNELSESELRNLAAIPYQIISPSSNAPIIGIYQDSMLGSYQFTRQGVEFSPRHAMNLLMGYTNIDMKELRNKKRITSFDLLSQITPPISLKYKTKLFEDNEDASISNNVLEITNGKYLRGQADKGVFASGTKGILNRICNDFGNMACSNYIDDLQQIITEYMKTSAYSVGISDLVSDRKTTEQVLHVISSKMNDVKEITDKVHLGILDNNSGKTNAQEFEIQVGNVLNDATSQTGKIGVKSLDPSNRFVKIVKSGSKGSMLNISQMISCLGQQSIDGKRVPYGFDNRTLPHFSKYDDSPEARGFVKNSYISGLTAPELFFHAMGGRMGLIDTAVKTATTGYIQRRLVKGLEDLKVEYDGTVRNNMGKIVQFAYGDDGAETTRVENQNIQLVNMSIEDIYMYYDLIGLNDGENKDLLQIYTTDTIKRFKKQRTETKEVCMMRINTMIQYRDDLVKKVFGYKNENAIKAPIAFQHIIQNIQGQLNLTSNNQVDITPLEFIALCDATYAKLKAMFSPTKLFEILFYFNMSPKEILIKKRFNKQAITVLMEQIILNYKKSIVHPGEMVGVIAGQSIGEPTTQLTLNSFVYETEILVKNSAGEIKCVQIGDFTKWGITTSRKLDYMKDKDTTYAELSEYYEVPTATEDGETVWRRIEAVTKHPVINEDGTNTMLKVTTKGCRELIATKAKSFLKLVDGKIIGIEGKDLKVGDYLPVSKKALEYKENDLDYMFGYNAGVSCAEDNGVSDQIIFSNKTCVLGFIDGFIDRNSGVNVDSDKIEIPSTSHKLLTCIQLMMKNLGVISQITFNSKNNYILVVCNGQSVKLSKMLNQTEKFKLLGQTFKYDYCKSDLMIPNEVNGEIVMELRDGRCEDLEFDKIISIEEVSNTTDYAYDLTVEDTRNFDCMNGLCVRDTFHLSGVATKSNVTRGVPRIEEILRLTRNPDKPSATVFLKPADQYEKDRATNYCNMIEHTKLVDVVKSVEICFDPDDMNTLIEQDKDIMTQYFEFEKMVDECMSSTTEQMTKSLAADAVLSGSQEDLGLGGAAAVAAQPEASATASGTAPNEKSKWIIRMTMDRESMLDRKITMDDIHFALKNIYTDEVTCMYADYNSDNLVFRLRLNNVITNSKKKNINPLSLDQSDQIYILKNFQDNMLNNIVLRGVKGLSKVLLRKITDSVIKVDGAYMKKETWVLDTTGTNLLAALALDYIDVTRTISNDIQEIYNVLGIEAARVAIYNELSEVLEFDNTYINYHHLIMLADRMTASANMVSIFRHGINNDDIGPIAKASFEETPEMFLKAARHAELDEMRGVSANVMCGQEGYFGTSSFQVLLDMNKLMKFSGEAKYNVMDANEEIESAFEMDNPDDACSIHNLSMNTTITNIKKENLGNVMMSYDAGF